MGVVVRLVRRPGGVKRPTRPAAIDERPAPRHTGLMPTGTILRPARPGERQALEALQRRASLAWPDYRGALLGHPDAIDVPIGQIQDGHVVVAERDKAIVGFAVVLPRAGGAAELDGLFVEPASWRTGIGRALIAEADRLAAGHGAAELQVIASPRAAGFYRACGFLEHGAASTRFGPAISMVEPVPG